METSTTCIMDVELSPPFAHTEGEDSLEQDPLLHLRGERRLPRAPQDARLLQTHHATNPLEHDRAGERFHMLGKIIGTGSFSVVQLGIDTRDQSLVAVKEVRKSSLGHAGDCGASAAREVQALERLSGCTHVIELRGHFVDAATGAHHIAMGCAAAGELFERLPKPGSPTPEARIAVIVRQMVQGVAEIHARGVAHCDLKLENACFDESGMLKWIDFGLAHCYTSTADGGGWHPELLTQPCGSPSYMPPEVCRLFRDRSSPGFDGIKADLWSMGVCIFALINGYFPFQVASTTNDIFQRIEAVQRRGESTTRFIYEHYRMPCTISESLVELLDALLRVEPKERVDAAKLLCHEWFLRMMPRPSTPIMAPRRPDVGTPPPAPRLPPISKVRRPSQAQLGPPTSATSPNFQRIRSRASFPLVP